MHELIYVVHPRADWHDVRLDIMRRADWAKFSQNPKLADMLLATGAPELIEDSPFEHFGGWERKARA